MRVRIMADFECWPLWVTDGEYYANMDPAKLGLAPDLVAALTLWAAEYQLTYRPDDPASSAFDSPEAEAAFCRVGRLLAGRVAAHLGPGWSVSYHDEATGQNEDVPPS